MQNSPHPRVGSLGYSKQKIYLFLKRNLAPKIFNNLISRTNRPNFIGADHVLFGDMSLLCSTRLSMDESNSVKLSQVHLVVPLRTATEWAVSIPITLEICIFASHLTFPSGENEDQLLLEPLRFRVQTLNLKNLVSDLIARLASDYRIRDLAQVPNKRCRGNGVKS